MYFYDKYRRLNMAEKIFIGKHPIASAVFSANSDVATEEAEKRFSSGTIRNGSGDAFRHCFWSAMNARDQGKVIAKEFGDAHEDEPNNPEDEMTMDLYNNAVGYEIGSRNSGASNRHLAILCLQAWAAGKLIQIKMRDSRDLIYSSATEKLFYGDKS